MFVIYIISLDSHGYGNWKVLRIITGFFLVKFQEQYCDFNILYNELLLFTFPSKWRKFCLQLNCSVNNQKFQRKIIDNFYRLFVNIYQNFIV